MVWTKPIYDVDCFVHLLPYVNMAHIDTLNNNNKKGIEGKLINLTDCDLDKE